MHKWNNLMNKVSTCTSFTSLHARYNAILKSWTIYLWQQLPWLQSQVLLYCWTLQYHSDQDNVCHPKLNECLAPFWNLKEVQEWWSQIQSCSLNENRHYHLYLFLETGFHSMGQNQLMRSVHLETQIRYIKTYHQNLYVLCQKCMW